MQDGQSKTMQTQTRPPKIAFSNWVQWANRETLDKIDKPGVYLLAQFVEPPSRNADPQVKEIIYIGETCNRVLKKRWDDFHRAAFQGKRGIHSGGENYREALTDNSDNLYVAAFPVSGLPDQLSSLFIRYVERKLILEYALRWGPAPKCNKK